MKKLMAIAVMAVQCLAYAVPKTEYGNDAVKCSIRLWGDFSEDTPQPGGSWSKRSKPVLMTELLGGGTREDIPFANPEYKMTRGIVRLKTTLPESGAGVVLTLVYYHASKLDPTGVIMQARQATYLRATMVKNGLHLDSETVGSQPFWAGKYDPSIAFNPSHEDYKEWEDVAVHNAVPDLAEMREVVLESPSGMAIMKGECKATNAKVYWFDEDDGIARPGGPFSALKNGK